MGGAYTAIADGPLALRYNPAGLAPFRTRGTEGGRGDSWREAGRPYQLFAQYDASIADINRSDLIFARPLWEGGLGLGISYVDYGSIIRTTTVNKTNAGTFGAYDLLLRIGYGREISERVAFGAALGWYQMKIDAHTATGVTGDLGALYRPGLDGLELGAGIRNIGSRSQFVAEREDLPLTIVLGGAYRVNPMILMGVDYEIVQSAQGAVRAGLEVTPIELLALRIGYDGRNEAGSGLTAGLGFRIGDLGLDYAYVPFGDLGDAHRVSAEWTFGAPVADARRRYRGEDEAGLKTGVPYSRGTAVDDARPAGTRALPGRDDGARPITQASPAASPQPPAPPAIEDRRPTIILAERPAPTVAREAPIEARPVAIERPAPAPPPPPPPTEIQRPRALAVVLAEANQAGARGDAVRQEALFREALRIEPSNTLVLYNIATLRYYARDYSAARDLYASVTRIDSRDADAWLYLGLSENNLGNESAARAAFRRAYAIDPTNAYVKSVLGL
jgi:hypothetical protein